MTPMRWQTPDPFQGLTLHATAAYDQRAYRFRNDDGTQTTATWKANQNTSITQVADTVFRLRIETQETGGASANNQTIALQYDIGSGWVTATTSSAVRLAASAHVANGVATTDQLTGGTGAFVAGVMQTTVNGSDTSFAGNDHTEHEWGLVIDSVLVANDTVITFRNTINGAVPNTTTATPTLTASVPPPPIVLGTTTETDQANALTIADTDLPVTAGLVLDLDATKLTGLVDNDPVATWPDSSGSGNDAISTGVGNEATYKDNHFNGLPVVQFSGTAHLQSASFSTAAAQPNTVFVVGKYDDLTVDNRYLIDGLDGGRHAVYTGSAPQTWSLFGGTVQESGTTADTDAHLHTVVFDGASTLYEVDGATVTVGNPGTQSMTGVTVGGRFNENRLTGSVAQVVVYDRALTTQEREDVEAHLTTKWFSPDQTIVLGTTTETDVAFGLAVPPLAPTLLTPADNAEITPGTFTWTFNPGETGDTQTAFAFRRGATGSYQWWNGTTWVSTETFIVSTTASVTISSGAWT